MRDELWHKRCIMQHSCSTCNHSRCLKLEKLSVFWAHGCLPCVQGCYSSTIRCLVLTGLDTNSKTHTQHTGFRNETTCLTLLRICPEVDTFLMSFCGPSCSPSLSDDSSTTGPEPPTAPKAGSPGADAAGFSGSCGEEAQHSGLWRRSAAPFLSAGMRELDSGWKAVLLAVMLLRFPAQPRASRHSLSALLSMSCCETFLAG